MIHRATSSSGLVRSTKCFFSLASGIAAFMTPQFVHHNEKRSKKYLPLKSSTQSTAMSQISPAHIETLSNQGYVVIPNFLSRELAEELRNDILGLRYNGAFREAKIGQDSTNELNKDIRIAETCFLGRNRPELIKIYGDDSVRDRPNGLYDTLDSLCENLTDLCWKESSTLLDKSLTELLYAYYPSGGFYRRHRDAIPNSASVLRKYSLLIYLNRDGWDGKKEAGQLRIHLDGGGDELPPGVKPKFVDVDALGGTLVLFKSDKIPHEVLDTNSERFALVGWYNRAVTASDIGNLGDGGTGDIVRVGMLAVALALVTVGVANIMG